MTCIYPHVAGKTLKSDEAFLQKLTKKGAKIVNSPEKSNVIIVFCPIVSRYKTDIDSALNSGVPDEPYKILVAMHHTFDKDYILPKTEQDSRVKLHVDCLFHEKMGLLTCPRNKEAIKMVRQQLNLKNVKDRLKGFAGRGKKDGKGKKDSKEVQVEKDLTNNE